MSEKEKIFNEDPRTLCKYGEKCYQKNPQHHKNFKHPPKVVKKNNTNRFKPYDITNKNVSKKKDIDMNHPTSSESESKVNNIEASKLQQKEIVIKEDEEKRNVSLYSPDTDISILKELFLVNMPKDFYTFFECLQNDSADIENALSKANLQLIGPYEFLLGKLPKMLNKDVYLNHWRFYYDPPEFQSVLKKKGNSQLHIGYFRDDPKDEPVFLAKNDSAKNCTITPVAENIFGAVYWFLQNEKKSSPFVSMACQKLMDKVKIWAEEHNYTIEEYNMKNRLRQIVCRTFHSAGIVVPYDKKTELGYRPLVEKDGKIKEMFDKLKKASTQAEKDNALSEIQPVITYANIAVDECDFGTGLEVGIALFCSGLEGLQTSALRCLETAYSLLARDVFKKIIQVHLADRRKGSNLAVL